MSQDSCMVLRDAFNEFLDKLVYDALNYTACRKAKTITPQDVIHALKRQGRNLYGYVYDKKPTQNKEEAEGDAE